MRRCSTVMVTVALTLGCFAGVGRAEQNGGETSSAGAAASSSGARAKPRPRAAKTGRSEVGLASFYGPGLNGDETASGEAFDQRKLVAAHRTLPLGSVVRVTNLDNGRRVVLRVVDRGPYGRNHRKGCIIDVSKAAAHRLGFVGDGLSRVRVDVLRLPSDEGNR
ncbi:MAG: septal ring lytic transglycosylase RlpA family protein [Acidobacteria bacterium]|nr:septal ring lytic transglycosylase RlpA family protein [Acidobacteriota bacterium]